MKKYLKDNSAGKLFSAAFSEEELFRIRKEIPMLKQEVNGHPFVYFNSSATALKPSPVIEAVKDYYENYGVNVFRGVDTVSYKATLAYEETRKKAAEFISAKSDAEIVFTRGTTDSLNMVMRAYGENIVKEGDEIISSVAEHHANFIPWQQLAKEKGARFIVCDVNERGEVSPEELSKHISPRTKIVALCQISNVMGAQNDIKKLSEIVHSFGNAAFVVDGAQGVLHEPLNVSECGIDFYAFSGHKLYAPTGVGILYGKKELLDKMPPRDFGGEMIDKVGMYDTTFADPPHRFEAGTPMVASVIGLGKALDWISGIGMDRIQERTAKLGRYLHARLKETPGLSIFNAGNEDSGIAAFNVSGVHAHDAASVYDRAGISIRAGQHCNQMTMDKLCQTAVIRASLAFYNTKEEIDYFIEVTRKAGDFLDAVL